MRQLIVPADYDPSVPPACSSSFNEFEPISIDSLREFTKQLKPTTSSTDIIPTRLFIKILDAVGPCILAIIRVSQKGLSLNISNMQQSNLS